MRLFAILVIAVHAKLALAWQPSRRVVPTRLVLYSSNDPLNDVSPLLSQASDSPAKAWLPNFYKGLGQKIRDIKAQSGGTNDNIYKDLIKAKDETITNLQQYKDSIDPDAVPKFYDDLVKSTQDVRVQQFDRVADFYANMGQQGINAVVDSLPKIDTSSSQQTLDTLYNNQAVGQVKDFYNKLGQKSQDVISKETVGLGEKTNKIAAFYQNLVKKMVSGEAATTSATTGTTTGTVADFYANTGNVLKPEQTISTPPPVIADQAQVTPSIVEQAVSPQMDQSAPVPSLTDRLTNYLQKKNGETVEPSTTTEPTATITTTAEPSAITPPSVDTPTSDAPPVETATTTDTQLTDRLKAYLQKKNDQVPDTTTTAPTESVATLPIVEPTTDAPATDSHLTDKLKAYLQNKNDQVAETTPETILDDVKPDTASPMQPEVPDMVDTEPSTAPTMSSIVDFFRPKEASEAAAPETDVPNTATPETTAPAPATVNSIVPETVIPEPETIVEQATPSSAPTMSSIMDFFSPQKDIPKTEPIESDSVPDILTAPSPSTPVELVSPSINEVQKALPDLSPPKDVVDKVAQSLPEPGQIKEKLQLPDFRDLFSQPKETISSIPESIDIPAEPLSLPTAPLDMPAPSTGVDLGLSNLLSPIDGANDLTTTTTNAAVTYSLLQFPIVWSFTTLTSVVTLLWVWDQTIEYSRTRLPATLIPILEDGLKTIAGLGLIYGLFLGPADIALRISLAQSSQIYFGDPALLPGLIDSIYSALFETSLVFLLFPVALTYAADNVRYQMSNLEGMGLYSRAESKDERDGLARVLQALPISPSVSSSTPAVIYATLQDRLRDHSIKELSATADKQAAELLVTREYLVRQNKIGPNDRLEPYLEKSFLLNLQSFVRIPITAWVLLIPTLLLSTSIVGESPAWTLVAATVLTGATSLWGWANFWKMSHIKNMLLPTVVYDPTVGSAQLLPPRVSVPEQRKASQATPIDFEPFEVLMLRLLGRKRVNGPKDSVLDSLYGLIGSENGSIAYLNSIRYHTWIVVASCVLLVNQVFFQDAAMASTDSLPFLVHGGLLIVNLLQLLYVPVTFLNYCKVQTFEIESEESS